MSTELRKFEKTEQIQADKFASIKTELLEIILANDKYKDSHFDLIQGLIDLYFNSRHNSFCKGIEVGKQIFK